MDNTQKIFIGTFLAIIVIGGCLIVSDKNLLKNNNVVTGTAASLLSLGKDITCTFEYTEDGQTMNGVLYITKNKDMRGDFITAHAQKGTIKTHVIQKGEYIYYWGLPDKDNFKTKIDENANAAEQAEDKYNKKISTKPDVQYLCKPWNVDTSVFEFPKGVVFQDK